MYKKCPLTKRGQTKRKKNVPILEVCFPKKATLLRGYGAFKCKENPIILNDRKNDGKPNVKKTPSFCGVFFNSKSEENATILEGGKNGGKNGGKSNVKKMSPFCRSCKENVSVLMLCLSNVKEKLHSESVENQMYKKGNTLLIKNVF